MTPKETGKLLGFAALYDFRRVDAAIVAAWHEVIGDLDYADCETAVKAHYAGSAERLMPVHVRERVREIRADRVRQNPLPAPPPELCDDGPAYTEWINDQYRRIAGGEDEPKAIRS